jgi:uncharacterized protein YkwD
MIRALCAIALMWWALTGCGQDAPAGDGGLLVPDNAQEARWGAIGQEPPSTDAPAAPSDPATPVGGADNPWNGLDRRACAEGGALWEEGGDPCGDEVEAEQLRLLNLDRTSRGLSPLRCHQGLLDTARRHSQDMAARGYFDHNTPEGLQPWDRMERNGVCGWRMAGENIAQGQRTPAQVQEDWMNSPGHRANILTPEFTHVGVGVYNDNGRLTWTQLFATF